MAHSLQLSVIAEGIEDIQQLNFLCLHQCEIGQGFLFSTPKPAKDITILLEQNHKQPFTFLLENFE
jgi:EAL domain-containing protein (putative c-di-GMP-specific phosphodiesterase class I)